MAIKIASPGDNADILTLEYENYLLLGANGKSHIGQVTKQIVFINLHITDPEVSIFGIPNIMYFGEHGGGYKVMVMKLLGPTLAELKEVTGRNKLFGRTIFKVAIQAVK